MNGREAVLQLAGGGGVRAGTLGRHLGGHGREVQRPGECGRWRAAHVPALREAVMHAAEQRRGEGVDREESRDSRAMRAAG